MKSHNAKAALRRFANKKRAEVSEGYFKTGEGEYGAGDRFIGCSVPDVRKVARVYKDLPLTEIKKLLKSEVHEERLLAVVILADQFPRAEKAGQKKIYTFYISNARLVNNWDLVDSSAAIIVGGYLEDKDRGVLLQLASSKNLWERRIAVISTYRFIQNGEYKDTFELARVLFKDDEDLIHKAVGWMLREVGKRVDATTLRRFMEKHHREMPRTMLRYAIEHFPESLRRRFMGSR